MKLNALDAMLTTAWAMEEGALANMLTIAARQNDLEAFRKAYPEAVAARQGTLLRDTERVEVRDGVAVIPVVGPIFRRANLMTEHSGATSVEMLARDLHIAMASENVRAVLLNIDSPGGQANGIAELANMVTACRKRKPVHAYVGGLGTSAAYWLASAAESITADETALLGSIGVLVAAKRGDGTDIKIVSSQSPKKHADVETEEGRATVQATIDDLAACFVGAVARNRGVTEDKVLRDFGQGGMLVGRSALRAGMVDRIGSYEGVLKRLAADVAPQRSGARAEEEEPASADAGSLVPEDVAAAMDSLLPENGGPGFAVLTISTQTDEPAAPAAATFSDHSKSVLAAVEGLIDRSERYAALRAEEGRGVSLARREEWVTLNERLGALLAATAERPSAHATRLRLVALRARLAGMEQAHEPIRCSGGAEAG